MRNLMTLALGLICVSLSFSASLAQTTVSESKAGSDAKQLAEMQELEFLVGTWKGTGWVLTQNGKQTSAITETFQYKLGGQIAVVDGLGIATDEKTGEERITHQAYGVFSYDKGSAKIKFRWYKAETGEEDETLIEISDKTINWGFEVRESGTKIKFTFRINEKGNWFETGEVSRDGGKTWFRFLEMELSKVSMETPQG